MLRARIADALGDLAQRIEHVGSTAVPGLPAKPSGAYGEAKSAFIKDVLQAPR